MMGSISGKILDSKKYILWNYFLWPQVNAALLDDFTAQPPGRPWLRALSAQPRVAPVLGAWY